MSIKAECGNFQYMGVEELQAAVAQLPAEELDRFSEWFAEYLAEQWDRRIEADILAGASMPPVAVPMRTSRPDVARRSPGEPLRNPRVLVPLSPVASGDARTGRSMLRIVAVRPAHPSLRLKKVGDFWSARAGLRVRRWQGSGPKASSGSGSVPMIATPHLIAQ